MNNRLLFKIVALLLIVSMALFACAEAEATPSEEETTISEPAEEEAEEEEAVEEAPDKPKVVLIGNQRFGDLGPMDMMAEGLDECEPLGFEIKKLEAPAPEVYEENIRAMAREGYDLIITTFNPMSEATKLVAADYPDTQFAAIYQYINVEGESHPNIWDTEFLSHEAYYLLGQMAGQLSTSKRIGMIAGQEVRTQVAGINGFMQGVESVCEECTVEYVFANTWEDPATGKELANTMISTGIDVIQTMAAKTSIGAVEAANEAGILIFGDNGDHYELYTGGYITWVLTNFGANVKVACEKFLADEFEGGVHGYMDLSNEGAIMPWWPIERFINDNANLADAVSAAMAVAKESEEMISSGELTVVFNDVLP
jgi:basic membrane protein A